MIDEFRIRSQVAAIEAAPRSPREKAKMIFRLARRLRTAALCLAVLGQRSFAEGDALRGARLTEAKDRLVQARADVRGRVREILDGETRA